MLNMSYGLRTSTWQTPELLTGAKGVSVDLGRKLPPLGLRAGLAILGDHKLPKCWLAFKC